MAGVLTVLQAVTISWFAKDAGQSPYQSMAQLIYQKDC